MRKVRKPVVIALTIVLVSVVIYFGLALVLIASESPPAQPSSAGESIGFSEAIEADYSTMPDSLSYEARDGSKLPYRLYEGGDERLIVLVHGSAWHGMQFHPMASALAASGAGTVVVPDLRGHGEDPERRGDIEYIAQLEDDLADLIGHMHSVGMTAENGQLDVARGFGEVVVGGHSSGGGLVVRFAGGKHGALAERYVLMAPFLKYNAPTTKPNSGGWAAAATRRIAGLTMLNNVGITGLNHLPVISFDMPRAVLDGPYGATATIEYSFRLNTGFAPRSNYHQDLAALTQPFLLIAGDQDEAFEAAQYEPVISAQTSQGEYVLLDGVSHIGVTTEQAAIDPIRSWIVG